MHRSGDEDEDAEPENCAAPLTCKEKVQRAGRKLLKVVITKSVDQNTSIFNAMFETNIANSTITEVSNNTNILFKDTIKMTARMLIAKAGEWGGIQCVCRTC